MNVGLLHSHFARITGICHTNEHKMVLLYYCVKSDLFYRFKTDTINTGTQLLMITYWCSIPKNNELSILNIHTRDQLFLQLTMRSITDMNKLMNFKTVNEIDKQFILLQLKIDVFRVISPL